LKVFVLDERPHALSLTIHLFPSGQTVGPALMFWMMTTPGAATRLRIPPQSCECSMQRSRAQGTEEVLTVTSEPV
jgi:hypothetical protein